MTTNKPGPAQREFVNHARSPRQPSLTPKQRALRDREQLAREVEELRQTQRELRRAAYERLYGTEPPETAA